MIINYYDDFQDVQDVYKNSISFPNCHCVVC